MDVSIKNALQQGWLKQSCNYKPNYPLSTANQIVQSQEPGGLWRD